jgi:hypothetical protein
MFTKNPIIYDTTGNSYTLKSLKEIYDKNISFLGCFTPLRSSIYNTSIQDYLIHPNYTKGIDYDYMAILRKKNGNIETIFYKLKRENSNLKIERILIDRDYIILRDRLKELLSHGKTKFCVEKIYN